jgi:VIT1/CCC1 family predicted Fe2+/Mn2+ transporter
MEVLESKIKEVVKKAQRKEITEYHVYKILANRIKDEKEKQKILKIAEDEKRHYDVLKKFSGEEVYPDRFKVFFYRILSFIFGYTFGFKVMEKGEEISQENYDVMAKYFPEALRLKEEEEEHERELLSLIDEDRLKYVGSMVLGVTDALVELTGALAGLTFALRKGPLIAIAAFITGFAASLSMAGSEYLSTKAEQSVRSPFISAFYTGVMYIITVIFLVLPYILISNVFIGLLLSFFIAFFIIGIFTFYISIVQDESFKSKFLEMFFIIVGVGILSFIVGSLLRNFIET